MSQYNDTGFDQDVLRELGFSPRKFREVLSLVDDYVDSGKVPGLVLGIARPDQPPFWYCRGHSDVQSETRITPDSLVRIASLTKPLLASAFMTLIEQGRCRVDDPVSRYFPDITQARVYSDDNDPSGTVPLENEMTLFHLLTHTAGWGYDFNVPTWARQPYRDENIFDKQGDTADMVQKLLQIPLLFQPGSGFQYGLSSDLLGYMVELIAEMPLDRFMSQVLFAPLTMTRTGFVLPAEQQSAMATLYTATGDRKLRTRETDVAAKFDPGVRMFSGGGGLISCASDVMKWIVMMLMEGVTVDNRTVLRKESIQEMSTNHLDPRFMPWNIGDNINYDTDGYGFGYNLKVLLNARTKDYIVTEGEYGWAGSTNTYAWVEPQRELGVLLFSHFIPFGYYPMEQEFKKVLYDAYMYS